MVDPTPPTISVLSHERTSICMEDRFDAMIKSLFNHNVESVSPASLTIQTIDKELKNSSSNQAWTHVQEFEDSYGLVFKWANSSVYQQLLKSLNVDTSTIVSRYIHWKQ